MFAGVKGFFKSAIANAVDAYFNRTTLLLHGDGTNGAQNNTFLDSSSNNFSITRNGNTTQGTFTPFSQTGWSNYFGSTSDFLSTSMGSSQAFGTGDFTVECFLWTGVSACNILTASASTNTWALLTFSNQLYWQFNGGNIFGAGTVPQNSWVHLAVSRVSGTLYGYVNGSQVYSAADSSNYSGTPTRYIGPAAGGSAPFYLSNVRVIKGTGLYSGSTITIPTSSLTAVTNTQLLTCQSNRFTDNSSNAFTLTTSGTPSVQAFSPFAPTAAYSAATVGGSGYFDGSGDYLMVPTATNAAFAFGTGDFSIELWTYLPSVSAYGRLFTSSANNSNMDFTAGGAITYYDGGSYSVGTLVANAWQHIVVTRQSGTLRTFLNGVMQANAANSTNISSAAQYAFAAATNGANTTQQYMAGIRVVKGGIPSAYVTSSTTNGTKIFNPPTAPFTGSESLTAGAVSLLLNFTNGGIIDQTGKNVLETVGNAQISTSVKKYGSGSLAFDGSSSLSLRNKTSRPIYFGTGNWTVEFWVYHNTTGTYDHTYVGGTSFYDVIFGVFNSGTQIGFWNNNGFTGLYASSNLTSGTWRHMAYVRNGNTITLYVNGVNVGSTAFTGAMKEDGSGDFLTTVVGSSLNGYMDDVRVTKYARYTANFTPPTAAFADQ